MSGAARRQAPRGCAKLPRRGGATPSRASHEDGGGGLTMQPLTGTLEGKHLALFFTHGVSLHTWDKLGLFEREVAL